MDFMLWLLTAPIIVIIFACTYALVREILTMPRMRNYYDDDWRS